LICPALQWCSYPLGIQNAKINALYTMEAEYIALSQSMRDLIPVCEILKEIKAKMIVEDDFSPKCSSRSKAFKESNGEEVIPQ
jgi:hypothetical protein